MSHPTRRHVLKQLGAAGAGLLTAPVVIAGQGSRLVVAGEPVEIAISTVNPNCVRITIRRIAGGSTASLADGALVKPEWTPVSLARGATSVRSGNLRVTLAQPDPAKPLAIDVAGGNAPPPGNPNALIGRHFEIAHDTGQVTFATAGGPILGLGQGGPQFDRRGSTFPNRSGQGAYQLRTHGGRVPVQWVIQGPTSFYIHQPLGSFDLTGATGRFDPPANAALPLDLFVVG